MKILHSQTNQDSLTVGSRNGVHLFCVCDGISTANAGSGDVASGITTHVVASLWEQNLNRLHDADDQSMEAFIERALAMANRSVCEAALRFSGGDLQGRVPMGTTAVIAVVRGSRVALGWLGDSRAYLVSKYGASLLTADMNQAGERLKSWHRGEELVWDPAGFALVGYVGHFNEDFRPEALVPKTTSFTLLPGERLVLCSDGITDYIGLHHPGVAEILFACAADTDPADAAASLVHQANRGGGGDNCSVIVATLLARGDDETEEILEA
jgi:serine/threonine protein phosphatase PrpC